MVNSSQGGGSKDTWVLAAGRAPEGERDRAQTGWRPSPPASSPAAGSGPELSTGGSQQQQQQQQRQQRGG